MRYLNPLRYIHYHTQLAIPTIYDESLSFYEIMNKTNLHFNEVINDMNENYEIIDKAFQDVLEQTNKWMEEAKAQADRAEQEANKSQASAEDAKKQADRASSEADAAAASALEAQNQADRASSEADRAHTEAENAKAQAQAAANSAQESATSAAASASSASESAASATESKKSADASAASATESKNSADASANSASQSAASATASQNSAVASANSASQAAQSATDAANSAKEAADTLDEAKETFVKKAGDTMTGKLTISYGGLSVDGSADISGDLNTGRLQVGKPGDHRDTHLYGNLYLNDMLNMSIGSNVALKFANLQDGLKLYAPLSFEPSPLNISNVANPQEALDAVNKQTLDSEVSSINVSLTQVNEKITSLTSRVDTAEKNITSLTSRVDKTETDITSLTSRVSTNETSINNINTEITNIKQDITTVEGDYVKKAGDTMTGNLTMGLNQIVMDTGHIAAGNNTLLFEGYPEIDVDGAKISMVAEPVDVMDATNKKYVDDAVANVKPTGDYLPLTGGTMSGDINMGVNNSVRFGAANYALYQNEGTGHLVLTGNSKTDFVEMNNIGTVQFGNETTIKNIKTPTNNQDAVPKSYVDDQISIAKNDVYEQIHNYLPLTGGTLTGAVRFGTTASIGELLDFGLVAKMDSGNLGIVTQSIIHTNDSTSTDGVTYTLANVDSDIHYTCAGNGVKQMNIGSFETVKVSSSLLVAENPTQNMQVATKQYVDQHAGGRGSKVDLGGNYIMILTPLTSRYSKFEIFVSSTTYLTFKIDGSKIQTQQLQVPYTSFLNNNNLELIQNDSVRYFIQTFKDNTTNSNIALSTYFKNVLPDTVYLEFTNLSTTHTEGIYYIYGGGKIMDCLVETKKIIS